MKIPVLNDLYTEVNRLCIAGAKFATGDVRIAKLVPTLTKMGEKSPAMQRLAAMTNDLLTASAPEEALSDLGVLLHAMLSTQGDIYLETMAEKESPSHTTLFTELPQSVAPYSTLSPVVEALTTTGSARLETLRNAFDNEQLDDFRLYGLLSKGLEDKHAELADYVAEVIIPSLCARMIPFLLADLDITQDRKAHARRLTLLDALGYEDCLALAERAVTEGAPLIQVAAMPILGRNPAFETLLLTAANDRKADVKEAALIGLVTMDSAQGKEKMLAVLSQSKFQPAVAAAILCNDPDYNPKIFDRVKQFYEEKVAAKDAKSADFTAFDNLLPVLTNKNEPHILAFYGQLAQKHAQYVPLYFDKVKSVYAPEALYDTFAPFYRKDLLGNNRHYHYHHNCFVDVVLDARWADEFIKKQDVDSIHEMLQAGVEVPRLVKFLHLYFHKRDKSYNWAQTAWLLVEYADEKDLPSVAKDLCKGLMDDKSKLNDWCLQALTSRIFDKPDMLQKLFGGSDLLTKLKDYYTNKPSLTWNQQRLMERLQ